MDIHGLQKLTLLDFPGHVACTVFLAGCDFRCPFCHNGGLVLGGMTPLMDDAALRALTADGLVDHVAMDIKNSPTAYAATVGVPELDLTPVAESAAFLLSGAVDYEFRTTAVAEFHTDASFAAIAQWIAGAKRYYIQCFTDRDAVLQAGLHAPTKEQLEHWADIVRPLVPSVELRGV